MGLLLGLARPSLVRAAVLLLCWLGMIRCWPTAQGLIGPTKFDALAKPANRPSLSRAALVIVNDDDDDSSPPKKLPNDGNSRSLTTIIAEDVWRKVAEDHRHFIKELLGPGLVDIDHHMMRPVRKQFVEKDGTPVEGADQMMTILDPKHPVYNFLVEYYGLKGLKGPKRLARWSPSIGLFFRNDGEDDGESVADVRRIESIGDYQKAASVFNGGVNVATFNGRDDTNRGIFLEGATPDDFALNLYLQGADWIGESEKESIFDGRSGILYRPIRFYDFDGEGTATGEESQSDDSSNDAIVRHRKVTGFVWYKTILENTMANEAILHCYGLHEWAMQYHPEGRDPPPSGKYQAHLPLRVSRETINETVERKGLRCTHVDALRFFAPGAGELNHHGAVLERTQQLELEQPGCVHAHMDLLKIALRIRPYCDPDLLREVLRTALNARALDVGASPYDCSEYSSNSNNSISKNDGGGIPIVVVPVESPEGRALYKTLQTDLMEEATVVRKKLLANYEAFGALAFTADQLKKAVSDPTNERYAKAEPGGKAWRQNLIDHKPNQAE